MQGRSRTGKQTAGRQGRLPSMFAIAVAAGLSFNVGLLDARMAQAPSSPSTAPQTPPSSLPGDALIGHTGDENGSWWAYIKPDHVTTRGARDDARFNALKDGGPVFWFVRDTREYVVRDPATLKEVERIVAPIETLAPAQKGPNGQAVPNPQADRVTAQMERQITNLIAQTLADGRAKPLKTQ